MLPLTTAIFPTGSQRAQAHMHMPVIAKHYVTLSRDAKGNAMGAFLSPVLKRHDWAAFVWNIVLNLWGDLMCCNIYYGFMNAALPWRAQLPVFMRLTSHSTAAAASISPCRSGGWGGIKECCGWEIGSGSDTAARTFNHTPAGTYLRRDWATGGSSAVSARHECRVCHRWRVWVTLCVFQNVLSQQSAFLLQLYFSNLCLYPSKL